MKPSLPRGTRDFGPPTMRRRDHILNVLLHHFRLYGFEPIETPAMENISTLTGKYGEEGDQLIYKILNSRIHENKNKELLKKEFELSLEQSRNSEELTEKALRYDLTVPFARFVAMNHHNLVLPFRRSQVQPVWRADRPQKGRYREFYQCDADIIGSDSLINELDLISLMDKAFQALNIPVTLKFNNRKILTALADVLNEKENLITITVALDKLDKVGKDGVKAELQSKGISAESISKLEPLLDFSGSNSDKLGLLRKLLGSTETGAKGIEEIEFILTEAAHLNHEHIKLELDITLARGLNYYTGTIFEVKAAKGSMTGSILGGGRYDDLTGIFGVTGMSGVGISFGIDRIYDLMEELDLFPESITKGSVTTVLLTHFDAETRLHCVSMAEEFRRNEISCEIYPDITKKLGKQLDYANKKNIPYVCTVGSDEIASGSYSLKHMTTGVKQQLNLSDMIHYIKSN